MKIFIKQDKITLFGKRYIIYRNKIMCCSISYPENPVPADAFVRMIDAFEDAIDMESFGFVCTTIKDKGRTCFHPSILLKLYP